jgi:hypothetical protein
MRGPGGLLLLGAGLGWALLSAVLAAGGHAPSRVLLPVPRESYYWLQAVIVVPVLFGACFVGARVAHRAALALGGSGDGADSERIVATAVAIPIAFLLVVPDLAVYFAFGFESLAKLVRVTAPIAGVVTLALATRGFVRGHGLGVVRAFGAGAAGVFTQALLAGIVLR